MINGVSKSLFENNPNVDFYCNAIGTVCQTTDRCFECKKRDGSGGTYMLHGGCTKTKADRLKEMGIVELADVLANQVPMWKWPKELRKIYFGYPFPKNFNARNAWVAWLSMPAEDVK